MCGLPAGTAAIINNFDMWNYLRKNHARINYITMRAMMKFFTAQNMYQLLSK